MNKDTPKPSVYASNASIDRLCKLPTCRLGVGKTRRVFKPVRNWQMFCCNECHNIYWQAMRPSDVMLDEYLKQRLGNDWLDEFWQWRQQ